jgi:hypothetical protein
MVFTVAREKFLEVTYKRHGRALHGVQVVRLLIGNLDDHLS